jgi:amino acid transporter
MGVITAFGSLFTLTDVIKMLTAVFVLIQSVAQVVALTVLRRRQPNLPRPYKMWLYPLPSIVALAGWLYIYKSAGTHPILLSLAWLAAGGIAFLVWARAERTWPFGPKEIRESFLENAGHAEAATQ